MRLTVKNDLEQILKCCVSGVVSVDVTLSYLQDWISQFGPLDDNDPLVKQFLKKIGRHE